MDKIITAIKKAPNITINKDEIKRFCTYLFRWQLSGIILAPAIALIGHPIAAAIIGNLIGGIIFFWIDRLIFKHK